MNLHWLVVSLLALLPFTVGAEPAQWKQIAEKDGIRVATRQVTGSDVSEVQAQGVIEAPAAQVLAALLDVESYPRTMPYTAEVRVLKREGESVWIYQVIDAPLASKRDLAMKISVVRGPGGRVGTRWVLANELAPPPREGMVRVPATEGSWELLPIRGGKATRATYRIHSDPGGGLPRWIVNQANKTAIPDAFAAVRKAATSGEYTSAPE